MSPRLSDFRWAACAYCGNAFVTNGSYPWSTVYCSVECIADARWEDEHPYGIH